MIDIEPHRRKLIAFAYRMLGSIAEAEDVVQDAFIRTREVTDAQNAKAYLYKTVARLALDRLKSARAKREVYVGTWLPEPVVEPDVSSDDLSVALLLTLERLSPPERTAFLLHDVFGEDFNAIAELTGRTSASCRKLAERAREQIHQSKPRFEPTREEETRIVQAFTVASATGDTEQLMQLLADNAILYTDGGGKRIAALNPIEGADKVARFVVSVQTKQKYSAPINVEPTRINGLMGFVMSYANGDVATAAIEISGNKITAIYMVSNPDKLQHLILRAQHAPLPT